MSIKILDVEKPKKLKRVALKEELVVLTKDTTAALLLQQLIFLTGLRKDFDTFLEEEKNRAEANGEKYSDLPRTGGWVYKTQAELAGDALLTASAQTVQRKLDTLIEEGWVDKRNNPHDKRDRTFQYRVDLVKLRDDLANLGYPLDGYDLPNRASRSCENDEECNLQNVDANLQNGDANLQNGRALPESTTERTPGDFLGKIEIETKKEKNIDLSSFLEEFALNQVAIWVFHKLDQYKANFPEVFKNTDTLCNAAGLVNEQIILHKIRGNSDPGQIEPLIRTWFEKRYEDPTNPSYAIADAQYLELCRGLNISPARTAQEFAGKGAFHTNLQHMFFEIREVGALPSDYGDWLRKHRRLSVKNALSKEYRQGFCAEFGLDV